MYAQELRGIETLLRGSTRQREGIRWWRTFLEEPRGVISVDGREIPVRAVRTRSERVKTAIGRAYREKYNTPGSIKFARDLGGAKSRGTTTELVPL